MTDVPEGDRMLTTGTCNPDLSSLDLHLDVIRDDNILRRLHQLHGDCWAPRKPCSALACFEEAQLRLGIAMLSRRPNCLRGSGSPDEFDGNSPSI